MKARLFRRCAAATVLGLSSIVAFSEPTFAEGGPSIAQPGCTSVKVIRHEQSDVWVLKAAKGVAYIDDRGLDLPMKDSMRARFAYEWQEAANQELYYVTPYYQRARTTRELKARISAGGSMREVLVRDEVGLSGGKSEGAQNWHRIDLSSIFAGSTNPLIEGKDVEIEFFEEVERQAYDVFLGKAEMVKSDKLAFSKG